MRWRRRRWRWHRRWHQLGTPIWRKNGTLPIIHPFLYSITHRGTHRNPFAFSRTISATGQTFCNWICLKYSFLFLHSIFFSFLSHDQILDHAFFCSWNLHLQQAFFFAQVFFISRFLLHSTANHDARLLQNISRCAVRLYTPLQIPPRRKTKKPILGLQNLSSRKYGHSKTSGKFFLWQIFE